MEYPKAWLCGRKKLTSVNRDIVVEVINVNPLIHKVVINNTPVNRNLEYESMFAQFLSDKTTKEGPKATTQSVGEKKTEEILLDEMKRLSGELSLFYNQIIAENAPDVSLYAEELKHIKNNISKVFSPTGGVTKQSLLAKGKELLDKLGSIEMNKKYEPFVLSASSFYESLTSITYSVSSGIVEPDNNDEMDFEISIKKGDDDLLKPHTYRIFISGGWKLDYSIGIYSTHLRDDKYLLKQETISDTSFYINPNFITTDSILGITDKQQQRIIQGGNGRYDLGMMVLAHFYPRIGYRFNFAASGGFGIDANHGSRYLLGGSIILGYEKRFCFTFGGMWGKVKRLASGLEVGQVYSGNSDQLLEDIDSKDYFFSISYNLGPSPEKGKK